MPYFPNQYATVEQVRKLWVYLVATIVVVLLLAISSCQNEAALERLERQQCDNWKASQQWPETFPRPLRPADCK